MSRYRLFFSYRNSQKVRVQELKRILSELLPNLPFDDVSSEVPHAQDWQAHATAALQSCEGVVCFVGEDTADSAPIDWEIRESHRLRKPLVVALLSPGCRIPPACSDLQIQPMRWDAMELAGRIGELLVPRLLFGGNAAATIDPSIVADQYGLMVQSCEALNERRQTVITMYLGATSALMAGIGVLVSSADKVGTVFAALGIVVLAVLGIALSFNWWRTVTSYGTLSRAKWKVVGALETRMPARIFDTEWQVLEAKRYTSTTEMDKQTAILFLSLFVIFTLLAGIVAIAQL